MRFRPICCLSFALLAIAGLTLASLCKAEEEMPDLIAPPPSADINSDLVAPPPAAEPAKAPEAKAPETKVPEAKAPEAKAPEAKAPEAKAPEAKVAEPQAVVAQAPEVEAPAVDQVKSYKDAMAAYRHGEYATAKKLLNDVVASSKNDNLTANCLCLIAASDVGLGDYDDCLKSIETVSKDYSETSAVQKGYVNRFATNIINQIVKIPTSWDYMRWEEGTATGGKAQYKESVPLGTHIVRVDFKLAFGLYRCLLRNAPDSQATVDAKKKLVTLITTPVVFSWVDEKVNLRHKGHPVDFLAKISLQEKKHFSEVICERIFHDWKTDKMYQCLNFYDEVRNLKHRYTATGSGPNGTITMAKIFYFAGYDPFTGNSFNPTESSFGAYLGL